MANKQKFSDYFKVVRQGIYGACDNSKNFSNYDEIESKYKEALAKVNEMESLISKN